MSRLPRLPRVDPWGPVLAVAGLVVFVLGGFEGRLVRDVALYTYSAQQFADGVPPYVAVLNRAGPLAHLVPGLGVLAGRAFGIDDLLAARLSGLVVSVAVVWVAYLVGRDLLRSRAAGALVAAAFPTFLMFTRYATAGPREKSTMVLFILLALWALTHRRWVLAGGAVALATLSLQTGFFPSIAAVGVAAALVPGFRAKVEALARVALGGIVVTACFVGYFAAVGALPEFYEGFFAVNAGYTDQRGLVTTLTVAAPEALEKGLAWGYPVLVTGLLWTLVAAALRLRRLDRGSPIDVGVVAVAAGTLAGVAWAFEAFQAAPDAFPLLPFAAVGAAGLVQALVRRLPRRWPGTALVALAALTLVAAGITTWQDRSTVLRAQERQTDRVFRLLGPDTTLLSVGAAQPLVFRGLRNPIRDQMFVAGLDDYIRETRPGGLDGVADRIREIRPTLITTDRRELYQRWLGPVLECCYLPLGGDQRNYFWYVTSTTDPAVVTKLRRAVAHVPRTLVTQGVKRSVP